MAPLTPLCMCTPAKVELPVWYHDVPVPTAEELGRCVRGTRYWERNRGAFDATAFVDMCMRFACLAYRRNAGSRSATCTPLRTRAHSSFSSQPDAPSFGVELQFSTPCGAHAVLYLMSDPEDAGQILAVLCVKGSTLSSPGSAPLSDWRANLQVLIPRFSWLSPSPVPSMLEVDRLSASAGATSVQLIDTHAAQVHPGFRLYFEELVSAMKRTDVSVIPDTYRQRWRLPPSLTLWELLLDQTRVAQPLCVGHSLGGAVAAMAATAIGASRVSPAELERIRNSRDAIETREGEGNRQGVGGDEVQGDGGADAGSRADASRRRGGGGGGDGGGGSSGGGSSSDGSSGRRPSWSRASSWRESESGSGEDAAADLEDSSERGASPKTSARRSDGGASASSGGGSGCSEGDERGVRRGGKSGHGGSGSSGRRAGPGASSDLAVRVHQSGGQAAGSAPADAHDSAAGRASCSGADADANADAGVDGAVRDSGGRGFVRRAVRHVLRAVVDRFEQLSPRSGLHSHKPLLVTFGCPIVGDAAFVCLQNSVIGLAGGLRVFNHLDPVVSCGYGLLCMKTAAGDYSSAHGGAPVLLRNDALTTANPYTNHLRYCIDSFEMHPDNPCLRVRYLLPGVIYMPDANSMHIAPSPVVGGKQASLPSPPKRGAAVGRPVPGSAQRRTEVALTAAAAAAAAATAVRGVLVRASSHERWAADVSPKRPT